MTATSAATARGGDGGPARDPADLRVARRMLRHTAPPPQRVPVSRCCRYRESAGPRVSARRLSLVYVRTAWAICLMGNGSVARSATRPRSLRCGRREKA